MQRENDIGFAVRRLNNAIKRDIEKSKLKMKIETTKSINGLAFNYFYDNRDKDIFQRDFEEKFSIRRSTASKMLKTMEQNGFIERKSVEADARLKKIVLTDKAIEHHKRILQDIERRERILRKGLNETQIKQFFDILQIITANMEEEND